MDGISPLQTYGRTVCVFRRAHKGYLIKYDTHIARQLTKLQFKTNRTRVTWIYMMQQHTSNRPKHSSTKSKRRNDCTNHLWKQRARVVIPVKHFYSHIIVCTCNRPHFWFMIRFVFRNYRIYIYIYMIATVPNFLEMYARRYLLI